MVKDDSANEDRSALMKRKAEEARVYRSIMATLQMKLNTSTTLKETVASQKFKERDYQAERKLLVSINSVGVKEGLLATVAAFIFLRRGPSVVSRLLERRFPKTPGYQLDRTANPFQQSKQASDQAGNISLSGVVFGSLFLGFDIFLSLLTGASVSMYFTNGMKLMNTVASIPLVEGRSVVCDEFCTTVQNEVAKHHQRNPRLWNDVTTKHDNTMLMGMHQFASNCSKRQSYERLVREQQGMGADEPVSIPAGGVPRGFAADDLGEYLVQAETDGSSADSDFFQPELVEPLFGDASEDQWAEDLVTDQEDDQK